MCGLIVAQKTQLTQSQSALRVLNIVTSHPDSSKNSESLRVHKSVQGLVFWDLTRAVCLRSTDVSQGPALSIISHLHVSSYSEGPVKLYQTVRVHSQNTVKLQVILQVGPQCSGQVRVPNFLDVRHQKVGRSSAISTGRLYPGTHFQRLSRPHGTWFRPGIHGRTSPVTQPGIDPGTVRLVAQCLNHYATPGPQNTLTLNNAPVLKSRHLNARMSLEHLPL